MDKIIKKELLTKLSNNILKLVALYALKGQNGGGKLGHHLIIPIVNF